MEEFYPSEVARLVLGYLKEAKCLESSQTFVQESPDLREHNLLIQQGKTHSTNVDGKSLLEILREYCILKREAANKSKNNSETFKTPNKTNQNAFNAFKINQKIQTQSVSVSYGQGSFQSPSARSNLFRSPTARSNCRIPRRRLDCTANPLNFGPETELDSRSNVHTKNSERQAHSSQFNASFEGTPSERSSLSNENTCHSDPITSDRSKIRDRVVQSDLILNNKNLIDLDHGNAQTEHLALSSSTGLLQDLTRTTSQHADVSQIGDGKGDSVHLTSNILNQNICVDSNIASTSSVNNTLCLQNMESINLEEEQLATRSIVYRSSEITAIDGSITVTTRESSVTPQYMNDPPSYHRAPNTNSPRIELSLDRSLIPSLTTPMKNRKYWSEEFCSPRRKGFIPRRRLLEESPITKQMQCPEIISIFATNQEDLGIGEELLNYKPLAEKIAENINKVKFSEEVKDSDVSNSYSALQELQGLDDLVKNAAYLTEADPVFDEYLAFLCNSKDCSDINSMQEAIISKPSVALNDNTHNTPFTGNEIENKELCDEQCDNTNNEEERTTKNNAAESVKGINWNDVVEKNDACEVKIGTNSDTSQQSSITEHLKSFNCVQSSDVPDAINLQKSISIDDSVKYNTDVSDSVPPKENSGPVNCATKKDYLNSVEDNTYATISSLSESNRDVDTNEIMNSNCALETVDTNDKDVGGKGTSNIVSNTDTTTNLNTNTQNVTQTPNKAAPVFELPFPTVPTLLVPHDSFPVPGSLFQIIIKPSPGLSGCDNYLTLPTIPSAENAMQCPKIISPLKPTQVPNVENLGIVGADLHPNSVGNYVSIPSKIGIPRASFNCSPSKTEASVSFRVETPVKYITKTKRKKKTDEDYTSKSKIGKKVPAKSPTHKKPKRAPKRKLRPLFQDCPKATAEIDVDDFPVISIPEPSPSNSNQQTALERFSKITGINEVQSPEFKSLISSAKIYCKDGGRIDFPYVRCLDFNSASTKQEENDAKTSVPNRRSERIKGLKNAQSPQAKRSQKEKKRFLKDNIPNISPFKNKRKMISPRKVIRTSQPASTPYDMKEDILAFMEKARLQAVQGKKDNIRQSEISVLNAQSATANSSKENYSYSTLINQNSNVIPDSNEGDLRICITDDKSPDCVMPTSEYFPDSEFSDSPCDLNENKECLTASMPNSAEKDNINSKIGGHLLMASKSELDNLISVNQKGSIKNKSVVTKKTKTASHSEEKKYKSKKSKSLVEATSKTITSLETENDLLGNKNCATVNCLNNNVNTTEMLHFSETDSDSLCIQKKLNLLVSPLKENCVSGAIKSSTLHQKNGVIVKSTEHLNLQNSAIIIQPSSSEKSLHNEEKSSNFENSNNLIDSTSTGNCVASPAIKKLPENTISNHSIDPGVTKHLNISKKNLQREFYFKVSDVIVPYSPEKDSQIKCNSPIKEKQRNSPIKEDCMASATVEENSRGKSMLVENHADKAIKELSKCVFSPRKVKCANTKQNSNSSSDFNMSNECNTAKQTSLDLYNLPSSSSNTLTSKASTAQKVTSSSNIISPEQKQSNSTDEEFEEITSFESENGKSDISVNAQDDQMSKLALYRSGKNIKTILQKSIDIPIEKFESDHCNNSLKTASPEEIISITPDKNVAAFASNIENNVNVKPVPYDSLNGDSKKICFKVKRDLASTSLDHNKIVSKQDAVPSQKVYDLIIVESSNSTSRDLNESKSSSHDVSHKSGEDEPMKAVDLSSEHSKSDLDKNNSNRGIPSCYKASNMPREEKIKPFKSQTSKRFLGSCADMSQFGTVDFISKDSKANNKFSSFSNDVNKNESKTLASDECTENINFKVEDMISTCQNLSDSIDNSKQALSLKGFSDEKNADLFLNSSNQSKLNLLLNSFDKKKGNKHFEVVDKLNHPDSGALDVNCKSCDFNEKNINSPKKNLERENRLISNEAPLKSSSKTSECSHAEDVGSTVTNWMHSISKYEKNNEQKIVLKDTSHNHISNSVDLHCSSSCMPNIQNKKHRTKKSILMERNAKSLDYFPEAKHSSDESFNVALQATLKCSIPSYKNYNKEEGKNGARTAIDQGQQSTKHPDSRDPVSSIVMSKKLEADEQYIEPGNIYVNDTSDKNSEFVEEVTDLDSENPLYIDLKQHDTPNEKINKTSSECNSVMVSILDNSSPTESNNFSRRNAVKENPKLTSELSNSDIPVSISTSTNLSIINGHAPCSVKETKLQRNSDLLSNSSLSISRSKKHSVTSETSQKKYHLTGKSNELNRDNENFKSIRENESVNLCDKIVQKLDVSKLAENNLQIQNLSKNSSYNLSDKQMIFQTCKVIPPPKKRIRPVTIGSPNTQSFMPFCNSATANMESFTKLDNSNKKKSPIIIRKETDKNTKAKENLKSLNKVFISNTDIKESNLNVPKIINSNEQSEISPLKSLSGYPVNMSPLKESYTTFKIPSFKSPSPKRKDLRQLSPSAAITGKPKAMAEIYRNAFPGKDLPVSPISFSNSSYTGEEFLAKRQLLDNESSNISLVKSPPKEASNTCTTNSCETENLRFKDKTIQGNEIAKEKVVEHSGNFQKSPSEINSSKDTSNKEHSVSTIDRKRKISESVFSDTCSTVIDCSDLEIMTPEKNADFYKEDLFSTIRSPIQKGKRKLSCSSFEETPEKLRKVTVSLHKTISLNPGLQETKNSPYLSPNKVATKKTPVKIAFKNFPHLLANMSKKPVTIVEKDVTKGSPTRSSNLSSLNKKNKKPYICNRYPENISNKRVAHKQLITYYPEGNLSFLTNSTKPHISNEIAFDSSSNKNAHKSPVRYMAQNISPHSLNNHKKTIEKTSKKSLESHKKSSCKNITKNISPRSFHNHNRKRTIVKTSKKSLESSQLQVANENYMKLQESPVKCSSVSQRVINKSALSKKTEQDPCIPAGVKIPSKWNRPKINNYSNAIGETSSINEQTSNNPAVKRVRRSRPSIKIAKSPGKRINRNQNSTKRLNSDNSTKRRVRNNKPVSNTESKKEGNTKNDSAHNSPNKSSVKSKRNVGNSPRKSHSEVSKQEIANKNLSKRESEGNERENSFNKFSEKHTKVDHCDSSKKLDNNEEKTTVTESILWNEKSCDLKFLREGVMKTYTRTPSPKKPSNNVAIDYGNIRDLVESDIGRSNEEGSELAKAIAYLEKSQVISDFDSPGHSAVDSGINILEDSVKNVGEQELTDKESRDKISILMEMIKKKGIDRILDIVNQKEQIS